MKRLLLLLLSLLAVGCVSTDLRTYATADRLTYDAISPEYLMYIEADLGLDADQKRRRKELLESWKERIDSILEEKDDGS